MTFNDGTEDVGDLMLSVVSGCWSPSGLLRFCFRFFNAGSFCSLMRIDDLRGSWSAFFEPRFEPCFSVSDSEVVAANVSLE